MIKWYASQLIPTYMEPYIVDRVVPFDLVYAHEDDGLEFEAFDVFCGEYPHWLSCPNTWPLLHAMMLNPNPRSDTEVCSCRVSATVVTRFSSATMIAIVGVLTSS